MKQKGIDRYKEAMNTHEELPSNRAWSRLNDKIQLRTNKRSVKWYRWLSVAASIVAIISVTAIYQHQIHEHNPKVFAYNSNNEAKPLILEELQSTNNDGIYDLDRLENLQMAYAVLGIE